jgi:nucleoside-diphosphate-sugar epimerase
MIRNALAGRPLTLYGTGECLRDYVYVDDAVRAFVAAMDHPDAVNGRHWIIASGESWKICDAFNLIADRVAHRTGFRVPVEYVDAPGEQSPIEERNFVADISGFSAATGWQPKVRLKDGIDRTINAFMTEKAAVG